jgi:hypothetical protein
MALKSGSRIENTITEVYDKFPVSGLPVLKVFDSKQ